MHDPRRLALLPEVTPAIRTALDHLTALAAAVLEAPRGHAAILHADYQATATSDGLEHGNHPVQLGRYVIALGEPLMLGDLLQEPLAAGSLPVERGYRAYAGVALRCDGERVGSLAVLDTRPRAWTISDAERLVSLGELGDQLLSAPRRD